MSRIPPSGGPRGGGYQSRVETAAERARRVLAPYLHLSESQLQAALGSLSVAERAAMAAHAADLAAGGASPIDIEKAQLIKRLASA